jgi:hypothetical protein
MKEKGVIREIIPWDQTRRRLFWRLRRRLLENKLMHKVKKIIVPCNLNFVLLDVKVDT